MRTTHGTYTVLQCTRCGGEGHRASKCKLPWWFA